jgi:5-methyltetrahydropteroyltriglutamate--homocysteine methyltransferase
MANAEAKPSVTQRRRKAAGNAAIPKGEPSSKPKMKTAPLATSVVGSYSVPEWLERLKTDFYQRRISGDYIREIYEVAIKAAIKDQERAGIDIVSDGELRRDNDIDYFLARMPGVEIQQMGKTFYSDYYDAVVRRAIPEPDESEPLSLGLVDDFVFTRDLTDQPIKFSITGPYSLSRKVRNEYYKDEADLVMAFARILNREARALGAAGVSILQIDEPFLAGYPDQAELAVKALNVVFDGTDRSTMRAVHVCYGNRNARPLWEGHYDFLFPAILEADIDHLVLEFARKGYDDLELFQRYKTDAFSLGLGVIDVKSQEVESPEAVAARVRRALQFVSPDRLIVNPDCGLRNLPVEISRSKLRALTAGTAAVRKEVMGGDA